MGPEGPAAQEPAGGESQSAPEPVHRERLNGVVRATRVEPAGRHPARGGALVEPDEGDRGPDRPAQTVCCVDHGVTVVPPARRRASATWVRSAGAGTDAASASSRTRYLPRCSSGAHKFATARTRRRNVLRTTAPPQSRPIAYPTWGKTPCSWSRAGTNTARTGPLDARAFERCRSAKAARVVIRPTDRGDMGPQTVSRWRPLSRRDFTMDLPARVDMRLRNPWVFARFRVLG